MKVPGESYIGERSIIPEGAEGGAGGTGDNRRIGMYNDKPS